VVLSVVGCAPLGIPAGAVEIAPPVVTDEGTLTHLREDHFNGAGSPGRTEGNRLRVVVETGNPPTLVTVEEYVEH
jgi:hypothetical protein